MCRHFSKIIPRKSQYIESQTAEYFRHALTSDFQNLFCSREPPAAFSHWSTRSFLLRMWRENLECKNCNLMRATRKILRNLEEIGTINYLSRHNALRSLRRTVGRSDALRCSAMLSCPHYSKSRANRRQSRPVLPKRGHQCRAPPSLNLTRMRKWTAHPTGISIEPGGPTTRRNMR